MRVAALTLTIAMLALSACSAGASSEGRSASHGDDYDLQAAKAAVAAFTGRPTSVGVEAPIEGAVPHNKTIYYIQCGVPACAQQGDYLQEATDTVGWKLERVDAGLTAETIKAAWEVAVKGHPDGVVTSGTPKALFAAELAELKHEGVPVVSVSTADPQGDGLSLVLMGKDQAAGVGERIAQYALSQNSGKAFESMAVYTSAYSSTEVGALSYQRTIQKSCARCTVELLNVPASSIGADLPTRITTYLTAHPNIQWVWPNWGDMVTGLPSALSANGLNAVKLLTWDSNDAVVSYLKGKQSLVGFDAFPAVEIFWRSIDYFIRAFNGEDVAVDERPLPVWFLTDRAAVPSTQSGLFPVVDDYRAQFMRLWKLH